MTTLADIAHQRLHRQHIMSPVSGRLSDVVRRLGAVQAQDYRGALWAVALRTADATEAEVERALAQREIVRTWPMRGTLHFVAPEDVRWMQALLAPRILARNSKRLERAGLSAKAFLRGEKVFSKILEGGQQCTREEMMAALRRAKLPTEDSRGLHQLWHAAHQGLICFGPVRGKQQTFVLLDEWIPAGPTRTGEEALAEIAHRYFAGHGPATLQDFVWWTGLPLTLAREAIELTKSRLAEETLQDRSYWFSPPSKKISGSAGQAYFLPSFDEYLLGYRDRSAAIAPEDQSRFATTNGMFPATVVLDSRVVATWKRSFDEKVVITISPFRSLSRAEEKAIAVAANHYGNFVDRRIQLER